MRSKYIVIGVVVGVVLSSVVVVLAGSLDSPAAPGATSSYTLQDIWNQLNAGTAGTQSTFTEPAAGPGTATMHTLNEIMAKAPEKDDTDGAVPAEVANGKKYWSLRTDGSGGSSWGLQTGTAAVGSNVNGGEGLKTFNIPDGFYSGKTATACICPAPAAWRTARPARMAWSTPPTPPAGTASICSTRERTM